jgi:hypothetical protein
MHRAEGAAAGGEGIDGSGAGAQRPWPHASRTPTDRDVRVGIPIQQAADP